MRYSIGPILENEFGFRQCAVRRAQAYAIRIPPYAQTAQFRLALRSEFSHRLNQTSPHGCARYAALHAGTLLRRRSETFFTKEPLH